MSSGKSAAFAILILTAVLFIALHLIALIPFILYKSRREVRNFTRRLLSRCPGKRTHEQADVELANASAPQLKQLGWEVRLGAPNDDVVLGLARPVTVARVLARPRIVGLPKMGLPKIVVEEAEECTVPDQVMPGGAPIPNDPLALYPPIDRRVPGNSRPIGTSKFVEWL